MTRALERLEAGMPIVFGGDKVTHVSDALARDFRAGDRMIVMQESGEILHLPLAVHTAAGDAVGEALRAFQAMAGVTQEQIGAFFGRFADLLEADETWALIEVANAEDLEDARSRGRPTGRLLAGGAMRAEMIAGLRQWRDAAPARGRVIERVDHEGWSVEQIAAPLGVIGFVFEGRPNVFADAAGVIAGGNTAVIRIGADALRTARAIARHALAPALAAAGLPRGAAVLLDRPERAAGWALLSDPRLSLAIARGSGPAVAQLGAVARAAGVPASLHGTGGAWLVADETADAERLRHAVVNSLDRKVCNTLNVCCLVGVTLLPAFLSALEAAGDRAGHKCTLHVGGADRSALPTGWVGGTVEDLPPDGLAHEWDWEEKPELSLVIVGDLDEAAALFNRYSPQFIVSLLTSDAAARERLWSAVNAPFVGDGFTRWVDGQYAFERPELGLSNWQNGRLFGRGGVLSGDGVFTVRTRMTQNDPRLRR